MDTQVEELIDRIKKDGVAVAENAASERIAQAKAEAEKIIADAKEEAAAIVKHAKSEAGLFEKAAEDAVKQAARNILLSFRDSITKEVSALVNQEVSKSYSDDVLSDLIPEVVTEWTKNSSAEGLSVLLNEDKLKKLEGALKSKLKSQIEKGLSLKIDNSVGEGFRIGVKDGSAYFDYSAESVADVFCAYLNPRVSALMKEAAK